MLLESVTVFVKPWYSQFYLARGEARWASDEVSSQGYDAHLEAIDGFVYVGTSTYGHPTEVTIEMHDSEPTGVREDADHVVEASVTGEGPLGLFNWEPLEDPVAVVDVPAGPLRLRGTWTGIGAAEMHPDRQVGGDEPSPERILIQAWPAPRTDSVVLRAWPWKD